MGNSHNNNKGKMKKQVKSIKVPFTLQQELHRKDV